jgi:acylphosphatase
MESLPPNGSKDIIELHAIISGKVQGVFFRATTRKFALMLNIKGTVCNLTNGSVEIYAQGEKIALERLLQMIKKAYESNIASIKVTYTQPSKLFTDFREC